MELSFASDEMLVVASSAAFAWVYATAWLAAIWHLGAVVWRRIRRRPAHLDWALLTVFLPALLAVWAVAANRAGVDLDDGTKGIVPLVLLLTIVLSPVLATLLTAWRRRGASVWLYLQGIACIFALPMAMVLASVALIIPAAVSGDTRTNLVRPGYFEVVESPPACAAAMIDTLGLGADIADPRAPEAELTLLYGYWLDATLKAVFLDAFELYGCGVSRIEHDTGNVALSTLAFVYRTMAAVLVLGLLLAPVLGPWRRARAGLRLAAFQSWSEKTAARRAKRQAAEPEEPGPSFPPPLPADMAAPAPGTATAPASPPAPREKEPS